MEQEYSYREGNLIIGVMHLGKRQKEKRFKSNHWKCDYLFFLDYFCC